MLQCLVPAVLSNRQHYIQPSSFARTNKGWLHSAIWPVATGLLSGGMLTAESMAPMKIPKATPKAEPMTPDITVLTAQLLIKSSWMSCSGVVGSILVYSFLFFGCGPCWAGAEPSMSSPSSLATGSVLPPCGAMPGALRSLRDLDAHSSSGSDNHLTLNSARQRMLMLLY